MGSIPSATNETGLSVLVLVAFSDFKKTLSVPNLKLDIVGKVPNNSNNTVLVASPTLNPTQGWGQACAADCC
jgi:hypothetical protein